MKRHFRAERTKLPELLRSSAELDKELLQYVCHVTKHQKFPLDLLCLRAVCSVDKS